MTVGTQSCTPLGTTTPTLTATSGSLIHSYAFGLTVTNPGVGPPVVCAITPTSGQVGTPVTITGVNFGSTGQVTFAGTPATSFWGSGWGASQIQVVVPTAAGSGTVAVSTASGSAQGSPQFQVQAAPATPSITSLSLNQGPTLMGFVITGTDFGAAPDPADKVNGAWLGQTKLSVILLNGAALWNIPDTNGHPTITVQIPAGATSGNVVVTAGGVASTGVPFTVSGTFGCAFQ
jgi:hypothetical protein